MDTDLLLTCESLRLSPTTSRGAAVDGAFTMKCVESQGYLTVDSDQAQVLDQFSAPKTVPEVLESSINSRSCLRLREFYELILKAHAVGILCNEQTVPMRRAAVRWFFRLTPAVSAALAFTLPVAMVVTLVLRAPMRPTHPIDYLWGWLATCGALSLGYLWAASTIRGADCEVYRPHFCWHSITPHFAVDVRDICMSRRLPRAAVHAAPAAALCAVVIATVWLRSTWGLVVFVALFLVCRPVFGGPMVGLIELLRRRPLLGTDRHALFTTDGGTREFWTGAWKSVDGRSTAGRLAYGVLWATALGAVAYRYLQLDPDLILASPVWRQVLLVVLGLLALTAMLPLSQAAYRRARERFGRVWRAGKLTWRRWRVSKELPGVGGGVDDLLRRSLLLRRLKTPELAELARQVRSMRVGAWTKLVDFDVEPAEVGVIVSGSVSVYRRTDTGRKTRFLRLTEGDIFGAHALVDPENPQLEVRTKSPCILLLMPREAFERLVVRTLGTSLVCAYVHKLPFLQRSRLCAHWRPAAIARFIEITRPASYPAGTKIIHEGDEVRMLAVIYQGKARALRGSKPIGVIRLGEVMGEISLLQRSAATAGVVAVEDTRCLLVDRAQFVRFMSRNYHVALQVERIASRRLGRAIFPLSRNSFEAH